MRYEHDGASQRAVVGLFGSHHQPELRAELEVSGAAALRRVRERLSAALDYLADTMTVRPRSATVTFRVVEATPRGFASSRSATIGRSGVEPRRGEDRMREGQSARAFVELSDTLVRDYDVVEFLSRLCQRSVEVLEVTAAGALLTDGAKRLQVVAASTETVDGPGDAANPGPGGPMRRRLRQRPAGPCRTSAGRPGAGRCPRLSSAATSTTATTAASSPNRPPGPTRSRYPSRDHSNPASSNPATSPPPRTADPIGPPTPQ